jgi:hypothetical protein
LQTARQTCTELPTHVHIHTEIHTHTCTQVTAAPSPQYVISTPSSRASYTERPPHVHIHTHTHTHVTAAPSLRYSCAHTHTYIYKYIHTGHGRPISPVRDFDTILEDLLYREVDAVAPSSFAMQFSGLAPINRLPSDQAREKRSAILDRLEQKAIKLDVEKKGKNFDGLAELRDAGLNKAETEAKPPLNRADASKAEGKLPLNRPPKFSEMFRKQQSLESEAASGSKATAASTAGCKVKAASIESIQPDDANQREYQLEGTLTLALHEYKQSTEQLHASATATATATTGPPRDGSDAAARNGQNPLTEDALMRHFEAQTASLLHDLDARIKAPNRTASNDHKDESKRCVCVCVCAYICVVGS